MASLSRRGFSMGAALLAAPAFAQTQRKLDFSKPEDNLYGLLKLLGDVSGKTTYWMQPGRIYAFRPGELAKPLFDYIGCTVREIRRINDAEYRTRYRGWMLMQTTDSDTVIDEWRNPYTSQTVKVEHFRTWVGRQAFTANGLARPANYKGDFTWFDKKFVLPWRILGDDVWCPYEQFSVYTDPQGNARYEKAIHTYQGSLAQLEDRERSSAAATIASQSQSPWFPWMKMDHVPGHMILRSLGRKYESPDSLPAAIIAESNRRYPGAFTEALTWD
jgi:Protein of unknown function (DUF1838)